MISANYFENNRSLQRHELGSLGFTVQPVTRLMSWKRFVNRFNCFKTHNEARAGLERLANLNPELVYVIIETSSNL